MGLRTAVAAYLQVARGIHCQPSQVFITSGYNHTMQLVMQALLAPGDRVWVEDPGYPPTRALLAQARLQAVPIPVDQDGLMVGEGPAVDVAVAAAPASPAGMGRTATGLDRGR
ncbi:hypothetical protein G6F23_014938 [Rhizopus arrhizus]|nr:hypothetical protein G6F23_014938 [Rhizopus arrhizus]